MGHNEHMNEKRGIDVRKYLNVTDVQSILGIGRSTAYALMRRADFPTTRLGRKMVVDSAALDTWAAQGGTLKRDEECRPIQATTR